MRYDAFMRGYICAVAEILRTYGDTVIARDVLKGAGKVDWRIIDKPDKKTIRMYGLLDKR